MKLIGDMGFVESHFGPFGDNITVGARLVHGLRQSTIGLEIVLDAPDVTPSYEAPVETRFGPFGDSANLDAQ
jgi:hypothetical protein